MAEKINNLKISNARIIFRNFSGRETKYNRLGNRNFHIIIDNAELAEKLSSEGWNIKSYERDGEISYSLPVAVSFNYYPPSIHSVIDDMSDRKINEITEDNVDELDCADIISVDAIIRPYSWEVGEKKGIKAYLKTLYVNIDIDEFAKKYMNNDFLKDRPHDPESDITDDDIPF